MISSTQFIQEKTGVDSKNINAVIELLNQKATVPFIARYRKDQTGNLSDEKVHDIQQNLALYEKVAKRKKAILEHLHEKNAPKSTIDAATASNDLQTLEQIFTPFKQKKKSKLETALDISADHLTKVLLSKSESDANNLLQQIAKKQKLDEKEVMKYAAVVLSNWWLEDAFFWGKIVAAVWKAPSLKIKEKELPEEQKVKFEQFVNQTIVPAKTPSYRFLAINRGAQENFLTIGFAAKFELVEQLVKNRHRNKWNNPLFDELLECSWKEIKPKLKSLVMNKLKSESDLQAVKVFSANLEKLLMASPVGQKRVLAIDPGYKSGCKVVALNEFGDLLDNATIYPHPPQKKFGPAKAKISQMCSAHKIEVIAIGNGTASQETLKMIKGVLGLNEGIQVYEVSEDGASVYSASAVGRKEFPQYDVTVRGAASIGRRLQDPLSELVKIDPMSLGVGQYQHDVDQSLLKQELDFVVEKVVNKIGVELNAASTYLLKYVAGIGEGLAEEIVKYRKDNSGFNKRSELLKVPKLGKKAFEQSAGFLRVEASKVSLDRTGVHPEDYPFVDAFVKFLKVASVDELLENEKNIETLRATGADRFGIGYHAFDELLKVLSEPNRDPRLMIKKFNFQPGLDSITDLKTGMVVPGIVTNVTEFGAFVNIGIKENGLVHKSHIANEFVKTPMDYIGLNDYVKVKVIQIDVEKKRIGLSIKDGGIILKN